MDTGLQAVASRRWTETERIFTTLVEKRPDYSLGHLYLGEARFHMDRPAEALKSLEHAVDDRTLADRERHHAYLLKGRTLVELGRKEVSDADFRRRAGSHDAKRRSRDFFIAANVALHNAFQIFKDSYDVLLWRAYALYRQENFRKTLDVLRACEKKRPGHWHHEFFRALALEGLHGPNTQSVEIVLELAQDAPTLEQRALYVYLTNIYREVPDKIGSKMPQLVLNFHRATGEKLPEISDFLEELERKREEERRAIVLEQTLKHSQKLAQDDRYLDALRLLKNYEAIEGANDRVTRDVNDLIARWSKLLDLQAENNLRTGDHEKLRAVVHEYHAALKMTDKLELKIALQQRINDLQLALTHLTSSKKVREIAKLLKMGEFKRVLTRLGNVKPSDLDPPDRQLYYYIEGVAHYRLAEWKSAVNAFQKVKSRTYEDVDLLHGLALVKEGERSVGIEMLSRLPPQERHDEVNRLLAGRFADGGNNTKALSYLERIKNPNSEDLELLVRCHKEIGIQSYKQGDFRRAVSELQVARKILDEKLHEPGAEVYTCLGNAYFRLEAFGKAKKVFEALINTDLTSEEKSRSREAFINLSRIHLRDRRDDLAYQRLKQFIGLGGQVPTDLKNEYGRLAATFADFMPLDRVHYWSYSSTLEDYNYTVLVKEKLSGSYHVERWESGKSQPEVWKRDGVHLVKHTGKNGAVTFRVPVNLDPVERTLPFTEYTTGPGNRLRYTSEVVAVNRTVKLPDGQVFEGCLQVRVTRTIPQPSGKESRTRYVLYLAPDVGEVKQEIYQDEEKVAETVLTGIVYKGDEESRDLLDLNQ